MSSTLTTIDHFAKQAYYGLSTANLSNARPLSRQEFLSRSPSDIHLYPWQKQRIIDYLRSAPFGQYGAGQDIDHIVNFVIERAWPNLSDLYSDVEVDKATSIVVSWIRRVDVNARFTAGHHHYADPRYPDPEQSGHDHLQIEEVYDLDIHSNDIHPPPVPGSILRTLHDYSSQAGGWTLPAQTLVRIDDIEDVYWCWVILDANVPLARELGTERILIPTWAVSQPGEIARNMLQVGSTVRVVQGWKDELREGDKGEVIDVARSWSLVRMLDCRVVRAPVFYFQEEVHVSVGPGTSAAADTSGNFQGLPSHAVGTDRTNDAVAHTSSNRQPSLSPLMVFAPSDPPSPSDPGANFELSPSAVELETCPTTFNEHEHEHARQSAEDSKPVTHSASSSPATSHQLPPLQSLLPILHDYHDPEDADQVLLTEGETVRLLKVDQYWSLVQSEEVGLQVWVPHWIIAKE